MNGSSGKSPHVCEKSADGEESRMKQGGNGLENGENVPILSGAILRSREILCKNKAQMCIRDRVGIQDAAVHSLSREIHGDLADFRHGGKGVRKVL